MGLGWRDRVWEGGSEADRDWGRRHVTDTWSERE